LVEIASRLVLPLVELTCHRGDHDKEAIRRENRYAADPAKFLASLQRVELML
jgi:hypothetical protein